MNLRSSSSARFSSRSSNFGRLRLGAAAAILLASSCSLVYDLSPDQCGKTSECAKFGPSFTCDEGVCVNHATNTGGRSSGGAGGSANRGGSGNTSGTSGDTGGTSGDTGGTSGDTGGTVSTGGAPEEGGAPPMGGEGGMPPMDECATHDDCFQLHGDGEPLACIQGECKALYGETCELILPFDEILSYDALRSTNAIIIGAFARIDDTTSTPTTQNYDLALSQINSEGGLPGANGTHRKVVAVVCKSPYNNSAQVDLLKPVDHLIGNLKVPAILAALDPADQQYVFEQRARAADVFMMVPAESDDTVVDIADNGLIYHMLAGPESLAVTYQPLLDMTVTHLQHLGNLGAGPDYDDVRVALVTATDNRFSADLGRDFETTIEWNGKSAAENTPGAFVSVATKSQVDKFDQGPVADAVLKLAPHIVVGVTSGQMGGSIISLIEQQWDDDPDRMAQGHPFYILSPLDYQGPRNALLQAFPLVQKRLLGLVWPATIGTPAYNAYKSAYLQAYPGGKNFDQENFFDATYFLLYGMAAAGPQIYGESIAKGMTRITSSSGTPYDVGAAKVSEAFSFLAAGSSTRINLTGANGRPNWTTGGGRQNAASVWCIDNTAQHLYVPDVLSYDESSGMLTGTVPEQCFTFPAP